jgi:hypothetical protein
MSDGSFTDLAIPRALESGFSQVALDFCSPGNVTACRLTCSQSGYVRQGRTGTKNPRPWKQWHVWQILGTLKALRKGGADRIGTGTSAADIPQTVHVSAMSPVRDHTKLCAKVHDHRPRISDGLYIRLFVGTFTLRKFVKSKKHCQNDSNTEHLLSLFGIQSMCCNREDESSPLKRG